MYCQKCGKELPDQASFCPSCGQSANPAATAATAATAAATGAAVRPGYSADKTVSPLSRLATLLLCLFVGALGVHRFYVGKIGTGVAMIFTLGGLGIWVLVDLIMIVVGNFTDANGKYVLDWQT
jgi:TM2 domain-containing membrane protein YozV